MWCTDFRLYTNSTSLLVFLVNLSNFVVNLSVYFILLLPATREKLPAAVARGFTPVPRVLRTAVAGPIYPGPEMVTAALPHTMPVLKW
jgi:hypothetical protein